MVPHAGPGGTGAHSTYGFVLDLAFGEPFYHGKPLPHETAFCSEGSVSATGTVCCPASCGGTCGGAGCGTLPGGREQCCASVVETSGVVCQDAQQTGCVIPDDKDEEQTAQQAHETTPMSIALDACVDGIEDAAPAGRTAR